MRRLEGTPGEVAEVDFGRLGFPQNLGSNRRRVQGFVMVLGYSRLSCIIPTFRQDLDTVIHCFEEAFRFFGGCPPQSLPDLADAYVPRFTGPSRVCGFPRFSARSRETPTISKTNPVVERHVSYAREHFFKGENFH